MLPDRSLECGDGLRLVDRLRGLVGLDISSAGNAGQRGGRYGWWRRRGGERGNFRRCRLNGILSAMCHERGGGFHGAS
jgi:hypothetical protein